MAITSPDLGLLEFDPWDASPIWSCHWADNVARVGPSLPSRPTLGGVLLNSSDDGARDRRVVRLLEVDPDLGADLDPESLAAATTELLAQVAPLEWTTNRGRWGPVDTVGYLGFLIVEGLLMREVLLLGSSSAEVLGEGDLLRPWDVDGEYALPVPAEVAWTVLTPCEVAVLNAPFLRRVARWPEVLSRLIGRTVGRAKHRSRSPSRPRRGSRPDAGLRPPRGVLIWPPGARDRGAGVRAYARPESSAGTPRSRRARWPGSRASTRRRRCRA